MEAARVVIRPEDVPENVRQLCRTLHTRGFRGWVVGGSLRDLLRGEAASDWDLATDARPEDVQAVFPRVIPTGIQHGTVTVRLRGESYEVTTLRGEGAYSDGRRPDSVEFVSDLTQDLARRDFTINAIAYDPVADRLDDPFDGLADLRAGVIRAVGEPLRRFSEDGLRVLRAARFVATLGFELDPATEAAIAPTIPTFQRVSAERVRDEWLKTLRAPLPSRGFAVMLRTGILAAVCEPWTELDELTRVRLLTALDACEGDVITRLGVLLSEGLTQAQLADWLTRFRFSNQERERVARIVRFAYPRTPELGASDRALRTFVRDVTRAGLGDVLSAGHALAHAAGEDAHFAGLEARLREAVPESAALTTRELAVSGQDVMTALARKPGPWLGACLEHLLLQVLDEPGRNTREALLALAQAYAEPAP